MLARGTLAAPALLLLALPLVAAHLSGSLLGVGLADCSARHHQLLGRWTFNASTFTVLADGSAGPVCLGANGDDGEHAGYGVVAARCPQPGSNLTDQVTTWAYLESNRLQSLSGGVTPSAGLCLTHAASGMLELGDCDTATQWTFDAKGRLSPATTAQCLVALDTPPRPEQELHFHSNVDCDTAPGKLLPFCDAARPIASRVANILSFAYLGEMPAGFRRLGLPNSASAGTAGECLHGFVTARATLPRPPLTLGCPLPCPHLPASPGHCRWRAN